MNSNSREQLKEKLSNLIFIRPELFEHLIYPLSAKVDDNNIIQLFRKLHIMSTIDYKISLKEWIDQSIANLSGFTEKEATILFNTYKIYSTEFEGASAANSRYESSSSSKNSVDVRYFGLFFALQLYTQKSRTSFNIDTRDKNPYNMNQYTSPLSSPRGKSSNSYRNLNSSGVEFNLILNYMKTNIKLFLRLIASDIHNTETSLNSNEFNTLKFFFKINEKKQNLSNLAPFFMNFSTTTKINIDIISEWLSNAIANNISDYEDIIIMKNLSKCVTMKDASFNNKNVKISNCEDSYIYINSYVNTIKIANCTNCTIVVSAVSKIATIDKCENCNICIAANFLRIANSIDSTIYSYTMNETVLFGDNRGLILGPHAVWYNDMPVNLKAAKLTLNSPFLTNFTNPCNMNKEQNFEIMNKKDFSVIITPFANDAQNVNMNNVYLLTPKEYLDVIRERELVLLKVKSMIKDANLQEEQEKALHVAIQGYFREWLVSSGNIKPLTEIVKMIDVNYTNTNENI